MITYRNLVISTSGASPSGKPVNEGVRILEFSLKSFQKQFSMRILSSFFFWIYSDYSHWEILSENSVKNDFKRFQSRLVAFPQNVFRKEPLLSSQQKRSVRSSDSELLSSTNHVKFTLWSLCANLQPFERACQQSSHWFQMKFSSNQIARKQLNSFRNWN